MIELEGAMRMRELQAESVVLYAWFEGNTFF